MREDRAGRRIKTVVIIFSQQKGAIVVKYNKPERLYIARGSETEELSIVPRLYAFVPWSSEYRHWLGGDGAICPFLAYPLPYASEHLTGRTTDLVSYTRTP